MHVGGSVCESIEWYNTGSVYLPIFCVVLAHRPLLVVVVGRWILVVDSDSDARWQRDSQPLAPPSRFCSL